MTEDLFFQAFILFTIPNSLFVIFNVITSLPRILELLRGQETPKDFLRLFRHKAALYVSLMLVVFLIMVVYSLSAQLDSLYEY